MPKTKTTKTKKAKTVPTTVKTAPAKPVETVAPVAPVSPVSPVAPVETESLLETPSQFDYSEDINALQTELKGAALVIKSLLVKVNALEKRALKDKKFVEKKLKSRPKKSGAPAMLIFGSVCLRSIELLPFIVSAFLKKKSFAIA